MVGHLRHGVNSRSSHRGDFVLADWSQPVYLPQGIISDPVHVFDPVSQLNTNSSRPSMATAIYSRNSAIYSSKIKPDRNAVTTEYMSDRKLKLSNRCDLVLGGRVKNMQDHNSIYHVFLIGNSSPCSMYAVHCISTRHRGQNLRVKHHYRSNSLTFEPNSNGIAMFIVFIKNEFVDDRQSDNVRPVMERTCSQRARGRNWSTERAPGSQHIVSFLSTSFRSWYFFGWDEERCLLLWPSCWADRCAARQCYGLMMACSRVRLRQTISEWWQVPARTLSSCNCYSPIQLIKSKRWTC
jgi:hypothetical protein